MIAISAEQLDKSPMLTKQIKCVCGKTHIIKQSSKGTLSYYICSGVKHVCGINGKRII
jgi:ssDNA-binding Zn-finger/Zn-ribbon topoisomerase 1